jgi:pyruvate/2-oxoglutarate dehydrogenase complex dihydrolipoamide acyltransferase (E2) component
MSYRLTSDHSESLCDGRMVHPGDRVSEADAKKNPQLLGRDVLAKERAVVPPDINATDAAVRLAKEHGLDLTTVVGTGKDGRIVDADVQAVVDQASVELQHGNKPGGESSGDEPAEEQEKEDMVQ